jgi:hypothetical protein
MRVSSIARRDRSAIRSSPVRPPRPATIRSSARTSPSDVRRT